MAAAIRGCEAIVSKFSRMTDETVGHVSIKYSQKAMAYRKLQTDLRARLAMEGAVPYAGGISVSDKITQDQDTDRVRPDFTKHMMEDHAMAPWTSQTELDLWLRFEE